jgi:hypothetical protein
MSSINIYTIRILIKMSNIKPNLPLPQLCSEIFHSFVVRTGELPFVWVLWEFALTWVRVGQS